MNEQIWNAAQHHLNELRQEAQQRRALSPLNRPLRLHLATALHQLANRLEGRRAAPHPQLRA